MSADPERGSGKTTRRAVLGGAAGVAATLTSGCVQRTSSLINRQTGTQIALTVKTVPADEDRAATEVARALVDNLIAVGIDAELVVMREVELRRDVLINQDFDIYVARYPEHRDPDFLRPLLHSTFNGEPGWQNPYGFTDLTIDDLLEDQRRVEGGNRRTTVYRAQREFARQQPFTVVGYPDEIRAVRRDIYRGWTAFPLHNPLGFLQLRRRSSSESDRAADDEETTRLRVTTTDDRVTRNFNPIAVEFRSHGTFMGLLFDPLARRFDGAVRPWLAEEWSWDEGPGGTNATVRLRDGLRWHDGSSLTADDVEFTYRFFSDTALGDQETTVPAPRFRGRTSLVTAIRAVDERTVRLEFGDTVPAVAVRSFTIPIVPESEMRPQAREVDIAGLSLFDGITEALVWDNPDPVASGVVEFERSIPEDSLVLRRFDDHFLHRDPPDHLDDRFDGGIDFDELVVRVAPSDMAAVELVAAGDADGTASALHPSVVPQIGRSDEVDLLVNPTRSFYHVGFNARRGALSNQRFRRIIARLLDKQAVSRDIFGGYLTPAAVPVAGQHWTPSDLRWGDEDPEVPFIGTNGDLDDDRARDRFREAGYRYNDNGELLER